MKVATDIGGTFTDLVAIDESGNLILEKAHTTPPNFDQGVLDVLEKSGINAQSIDAFFHGTTTIINALTERKGAKTALITTKGFRDILELARGNRPDLFNLVFEKPAPFVPRYLRREVTERISYRGEVLTPLCDADIAAAVEYLKKEQVEAIAVCYINSYANEQHERETVAKIKALWPEVYVCPSVDITKEWREYERTSTAVLNAYVMPVASSYIDRLGQRLTDAGISGNRYIMQSNGGTTTFDQAKLTPINVVESGPVAGVFGASILGRMIGEANLIAFDVGGTTAKCSLIDQGEVKVTTSYYIEKNERSAGYPIMAPVVDIVEIGNGGGSIAWIDEGGSLKVGPKSAGALPGPVAYGKGGEDPTTTDANLIAGRLSAENFDMEVSLDHVRQALVDKVGNAFSIDAEESAESIIRVADANMMNALKLISVRRGYDPRDFAMVAFGGGGPMHGPTLAKELNIRKVIVPVAASVFSAWGMLMSDIRHDFIQTRILSFQSAPMDTLNAMWRQQMEEAQARFAAEGIAPEETLFRFIADMRYMGQEHTVQVSAPAYPWKEEDRAEILSRFHKTHEHFYTFSLPDTPAEIVNLHLVAYGQLTKPALQEIAPQVGDIAQACKETRRVFFSGDGWLDTPIYDRRKLGSGAVAQGPLVVEEPTTATVVCPGQTLTVDRYGNLIVETEVE
ncbi:MAG TPA: hydantoinase/oxoprolinase family protein [Candidatus Avoscillospira avicola]|uniref:Hydantoinase/oxoprolinase family protein n=1 Tax=Candidatus Avoscillospira avicola TaxID=2840706 RepID=A0A9D1AR25_9FIRM|nr:hydantoinase/oxoprolinase family protein [Candidatus Avoscillospira avicola]